MISTTLFTLTLLAAPPKASGQPQILESVNRVVNMDPEAERHAETIRGAPFQMVSLKFPEALDNVACGNCTNKNGEQPENWWLRFDQDQGRVYLKPTRLPDPAHPYAAFLTTAYVTLESGYTVTLKIRLARLNNAKYPPDAEVVFTLPDRALSGGKVNALKQELEAEYASRLGRETMNRFLQTLMGDLECEDAWGRPYQQKRLYVRVSSYCRVQSDPDTYWVIFEVHNRNSALIELEGAALIDESSADPLLEDSSRAFRMTRTTLRFDEKTRGIALTTLAQDQSPPAGWTLYVREKGGSSRVVTVDGIEF